MEEQIKSIESIENMLVGFLENSTKTIISILDKKNRIEFESDFEVTNGYYKGTEYISIKKINDDILLEISKNGHWDNYDDLDSLDKLRLFKKILSKL